MFKKIRKKLNVARVQCSSPLNKRVFRIPSFIDWLIRIFISLFLPVLCSSSSRTCFQVPISLLFKLLLSLVQDCWWTVDSSVIISLIRSLKRRENWFKWNVSFLVGVGQPSTFFANICLRLQLNCSLCNISVLILIAFRSSGHLLLLPPRFSD